MNDVPWVYAVDNDSIGANFISESLTQDRLSCRTFSSAEEFLAEIDTKSAGCVVVDMHLPGMNGAELQQHLRRQNSALSVIVLVRTIDVRTAVRLMENGAITLLQKPCCSSALVENVRRGLAASSRHWQTAQHKATVEKRLRLLTEEEHEVMECLLNGMSNKAIASRLVLSHRTVDRRRRAILEKMNVSSLPELFRLLYTGRTKPFHFATKGRLGHFQGSMPVE